MTQQPTADQRSAAAQASTRDHSSDRGSGSTESFKERVRRWREEAILQATGEVLLETGCVGLTMDDVASRVGVAKGSLYLHTPRRQDLINRVLDAWTTDVPPPSAVQSTQEDRLGEACAGLLSVADRGGSQPAVAFPCCLHVSPCPSGWPERWKRIAASHGLDVSADTELLGEAIQAVAATPFVGGLVSARSFDHARQIIRRFVGGASPKTPAP